MKTAYEPLEWFREFPSFVKILLGLFFNIFHFFKLHSSTPLYHLTDYMDWLLNDDSEVEIFYQNMNFLDWN